MNDLLFGPFDCALCRAPLRASLESLDRLGIVSLSKDKVQHIASKPGRELSRFLPGAYSRICQIRE
jgi:hypothetical protein